ncbi:lipase (class 3) [Chitinophaga skermanii]|uniref:Lipase (Class 3) n=1 Tax=Chitinophaga skermanii TaxID=331697 RepID=A0A327Q4M2_9BACT|nr:lipase family protein [Chitinophaga skermanii]RAI98681.1 lipase (class 3) [Chitinophaga skermanii]
MRLILCYFLILIPHLAPAQQLQPGFDPKEYLSLLEIPERTDSTGNFKEAKGFTLKYVSPEVGLYNRWALWERADGVDIIRVRGTIPRNESWLANFYAGMIPAHGTLQINDSTKFEYKLTADQNKAFVHTGWTISLAHLAPTIEQQILAEYAKGKREFIIMGHSQGGAITFLLRSYLYYNPRIPKDIIFKTYSSAAPKPGNLFFAYDYDFITRGGWGLRVVNSEDWVPETPFSLQTLKDFNHISAFMNVKKILHEQDFFARLAGSYVYNKMDRTTKRSERRFRKYLGNYVYKMVKKTLPELKQPNYVRSHNYQLAGTPIILLADSAYHEKFKFDGKNVFMHHMFEPYIYLVEKYYLQNTVK